VISFYSIQTTKKITVIVLLPFNLFDVLENKERQRVIFVSSNHKFQKVSTLSPAMEKNQQNGKYHSNCDLFFIFF
jgi:hypothetical protein